METAEQFSLCWNNFHSNLSTGFHSLLKNEYLVDVTLAAEGKFVKAHKTVLSVCSPFFKELFTVNPCEHPIVILPDVTYDALRSVLHFMYQGEVSVSQDEIAQFMRVAETLRVKGLTDNVSDATNGFLNPSKGCFNPPESRQHNLKRPRPAKKVIRPMQPLRPLESPALAQIPLLHPLPLSPPPKKIALDLPASSSHTPRSSPGPQTQALPLVKPKDEPPDPSEEEKTSRSSSEEINMEIANMLDTSLGEPSPSHQIPSWPTLDMSMTVSDDITQTGSNGGLRLLKSGKGQLVLIHNGHMYTYCDQRDNRSLWVCVKKKTLNCKGCLTTLQGPVLLTATGHNHPQINEVIQRLQVPKSSVSPGSDVKL